MRKIFVVRVAGFLLLSVITRGFAGSEDSTHSPLSRVTIRSDVDSARVILDGTEVGRTPLTIDTLAPGKHILKLQHPHPEHWLSQGIVDTVETMPGDTLALRYQLIHGIIIRSDPFGAEVFSGDTLLGVTPLLVEKQKASASILVRKVGYQNHYIALHDTKHSSVLVKMEKLFDQIPDGDRVVLSKGQPGPPALPLIVSGASSIVAGALAAHFKVKADNLYGDYLITGDPEKRAETQRFDTAAGISLAIAQVGLGVFAYFLLSP